MTTLEVTEIAAVVSEAVCDISSGYTRVARVLPGRGKRRTVEITWDDTPRGNPLTLTSFGLMTKIVLSRPMKNALTSGSIIDPWGVINSLQF